MIYFSDVLCFPVPVCFHINTFISVWNHSVRNSWGLSGEGETGRVFYFSSHSAQSDHFQSWSNRPKPSGANRFWNMFATEIYQYKDMQATLMMSLCIYAICPLKTTIILLSSFNAFTGVLIGICILMPNSLYWGSSISVRNVYSTCHSKLKWLFFLCRI